MESLRVAGAIDRIIVIKFRVCTGVSKPKKEKQFACIQNIADGRDVMKILPTGYEKTLIYIILHRVLDMLPGKHIGWHMVLPVGGWSSEERLHMLFT